MNAGTETKQSDTQTVFVYLSVLESLDFSRFSLSALHQIRSGEWCVVCGQLNMLIMKNCFILHQMHAVYRTSVGLSQQFEPRPIYLPAIATSAFSPSSRVQLKSAVDACMPQTFNKRQLC